ncbi:MAG: MFS transporter [Rhodospirillaceae bacterium]|jgi:MFS family permease|nr:MFS transporter [Rhodospirillaceae bacterium]MBT3883795.1 MFS transporter [Rhodospirillaceae bacterium]MBT4115630.1 MFS transporter [Rhodospirillaceae bacterium]MBT4671336.1 MFS transporter [Rhodospirillaceae bacterium]MBT4750871.1 MFS transporter [Rhodospirillaceae bacterium]
MVTPQPTPPANDDLRAPKLIKRNMTLFVLSQSFNGAGVQLAYGFGPLMVIALTGSASLAGLIVGIIGASRFLVAYTAGRITDRYGRRPGILLGQILSLIGGLTIGSSLIFDSFIVFVIGMMVFGMGMNAAQQLRVAATDMFPPSRRAQALGYLALGSVIGLMVTPLLVTVTEPLALKLGLPHLGVPWLALPLLIIPGMVLVYFVRPDPKEIGMNLERYYPGYKAPPKPKGERPPFSPASLFRNPDTRLAIISNCAANGNMSIVMVLTSLVLSHHGHSLPAIAFSHMFHSAGMFAFTIPLGRLSDRLGRQKVMFTGVGVALIGASLVALTDGFYVTVTLGTFLVGLGWAAANVSATALIADRVETQERGRAIGVNDSFAGAISVVMALATGPLIQAWGLPAAGLLAVAAAAPPLLMRIAMRGQRTETGTPASLPATLD